MANSWPSSEHLPPKLPTPTSALPDPNLTLTSCWSTDSKKPHRWRRLQNKATNIDCMPDIPYTYSGPENVPLIAPSSGRIRSPTRHVILWACPSPHPKQHLERFNLFCTAHGCLQWLIVNPGVPFNYIFKMFLLSNLYLYFIVTAWIQHALWPCRINDFGFFWILKREARRPRDIYDNRPHVCIACMRCGLAIPTPTL